MIMCCAICRSALWRFLDRHGSSSKKSLRAAEQHRADVARARRRWIRQQGFLDTTRLVFIDETATSINMVRLLPAWRATDQPCSSRSMEDDHIRRYLAA